MARTRRPPPPKANPPPWPKVHGNYPPYPPAPTTTPPPGAGPIPAYPILTEEIGYPPSPLANGGAQASRNGAAGAPLGPLVTKALQDVLGWKVNDSDPKGFLGALNQSFKLKMVEGHVESTWTPRSYVVANDLAGGISGAQASLYAMAKTLLDQALPLVDGLYPLDPATDLEYVAALKQLATSQLSELVNELAYLGGPRVIRVNQYFQMLLGIRLAITPGNSLATPPTLPSVAAGPPASLPADEPVPPSWTSFWTNPDGVLGTLGNLRDELGLAEPISSVDKEPSYINTIEDEQNVTNFRILVDYTNSLLNSWINSFAFFYTTTMTPFLGTQLVLISRQLGVISETVDEVRFVLASVFIGPAERKTFALQNLVDPTTNPPTQLPEIFLEDLLSWIQKYVTEEAPGIIQTGGRIALGSDFAQMIWQFVIHVFATYKFAQGAGSSAIATDRVLFALSKLSGQLYELYNSAFTVGVPYLATRQ